MIDTELKFKSKLKKSELLRQLAERWDLTYIEEVTNDDYQWEATENYDYLTFFPEYLSYPTEAPEIYYLRYYWMVVSSKRFEKKMGHDLGEFTEKILEEHDQQGYNVDINLLEKLHYAAIDRVAKETEHIYPTPKNDRDRA